MSELPHISEREEDITLIPLTRLSKDVRDASARLSAHELRWLVDTYYALQENRKASGNQVRTQFDAAEPNEIVKWIHITNKRMEETIKASLQTAAQHTHMGEWALSVVGIGPVLAAGLLAYIEIEKAPTVSHIWRFAGLDPTSVWEKGQKRPWNARLKVLCWKISESFVKWQNHPNGVYGRLFVQRKRLEWERNLRGDFAAQATDLATKFKKTTDAYPWYAGHYAVPHGYVTLAADMMHVAAPIRHSDLLLHTQEGERPYPGAPRTGLPMLPPGHIHARAKRWAVKSFLADWHREAYKEHYGKEPALPYALEHLPGHSDYRVPMTDRYISVDEARELLAGRHRKKVMPNV